MNHEFYHADRHIPDDLAERAVEAEASKEVPDGYFAECRDFPDVLDKVKGMEAEGLVLTGSRKTFSPAELTELAWMAWRSNAALRRGEYRLSEEQFDQRFAEYGITSAAGFRKVLIRISQEYQDEHYDAYRRLHPGEPTSL